jgi:hypothetical protein
MNPLHRGRGSTSTRVQMRKGAASAPAPLTVQDTPRDGYAEFLRTALPRQPDTVASHRLGQERVWLKKAGPRHGKWGYRVMALFAHALRLDIIKPVPNPGGEAAVATEARRLRELGAAGLRVPVVLAQEPGGLLLSDLGQSHATVTVQERIEQAAAAGPASLLAVWREGLEAIAAVHAHGAYLSQAFDRNLVQCPDGVIGYIDFEDDPGETLDLVDCQVRDWLSYLHSTAMLVRAAAPQAAGEHWHAMQQTGASDAVRTRIADASRRMRWLRKLPASRRWGRDTQRVRAVARLLGRWYPDPN